MLARLLHWLTAWTTEPWPELSDDDLPGADTPVRRKRAMGYQPPVLQAPELARVCVGRAGLDIRGVPWWGLGAKHCTACNRLVHDWKRNISWGEWWACDDPVCANGCAWPPCGEVIGCDPIWDIDFANVDTDTLGQFLAFEECIGWCDPNPCDAGGSRDRR